VASAGHVLSYADSLRGGGVERALLRLAAGWVGHGRRVTLVIADPTGPLAAELPSGVTLARGGLVAAVRAARPDIVFCPGNYYTSRAAWMRWRLGAAAPPIVAKMSNAFVRPDFGVLGRWGHRRWLAEHRRFLDAVVAMTPALAEEAADATGVPAARIRIIPNPPAHVLPMAAPTSLPTGRYILGVGRLVPQKRWDRLVAALPRIADPAVSLVILGEGPERARLLAQAAALGVAERLSLPGHAADPMPALEGAAVAALTSDFEGVPGVLREALAMGTPAVATRSSRAIPEIISRAELGTIVPREDADALVAALDAWLRPDARRPAPVAAPGEDSAAAYLALFDDLVRARRA
jgi:glycosyltransferase involved in cell wall biosynthesis